MSNRYVTDKEREGTLRRQAEYRKRLKTSGLRVRSMTLTDAEDARVREIVAAWRAEKTDLELDMIAMCVKLKPPA